ncbi:MAG: hypothetical protein QXO51_01290 [Halobacteria archaeon]
MDRRAIDAEIRELQEGVRRSPACARLRKSHDDYSMEIFWRLGVSQVRFRKTLAASYAGGDATVRTITVEKTPAGYRVRDVTTRDTFRPADPAGRDEAGGECQNFESLERALEWVERMVEQA